MKIPVIFAASLLLLVAPAASQEPKEGQMMYCDDAGCSWINDPEVSGPRVLSAPPQADWPVDPLTGQAVQPPVSGSQPVVIYGYSPITIPAAIVLKPPHPMCAPTKGQALAQFATGVETKNINQVLSAYEWTNVSDSTADGIIARLSSLVSGSWQRRYMEASFDADFSTTTHEQSFRWSSSPADPGMAFDLVENTGCWFVKFAGTGSPIAPAPPPPPEAVVEPDAWIEQ